MSDVDPVLMALSDQLVITALERTWARQRRSNRPSCDPSQRWRQYVRFPVPEDRIETVLREAWVLCPLLAARHHLDVDPELWARILDGYTRTMLMMAMPHHPERLSPHIAHLAPPQDQAEWNSDDVWGTHA